MTPVVAALRRYPVKAMGGESLSVVRFDARGMVGDRWFAVRDGTGRFAAGKNTRRFRRRDRIFDYRAATSEHGVVVTGPAGRWTVGDRSLEAHLSDVMGEPVHLAAEADVRHQDAGAVSLVGTATLDWCERRWGVDADPRRLRVNILLETTEPFVEETWLGTTLRMGSAALKVTSRVQRCRVIDVAQDDATAGVRWLKRLAEERDMSAAVYAAVVEPGAVGVGDPARGL